MQMSRRSIIVAASLSPILTLPGCAGGTGFSLVDAIRRLLTLSSQNALGGLMKPNGFYDDALTKIQLPSALGGSQGASLASIVLGSSAFRDRLTRQVNRAAEKGAELAAPVVADAISKLSISDAASIISGGGPAATGLLKTAMGNALFSKMLPGIDNGLRLFDSPVVAEALRQVTKIDLSGLRDDISTKASEGIYKAIGREEMAIRANPASTNDPLLMGVFAVAKRL